MDHGVVQVLDVSATVISPSHARRTDRHRLAGVVKVDGVPAQRRIVVLDRVNFNIYAQTLSRPVTGAWETYGLPEYPEKSLMIICLDNTGDFNSEIADYVSQTANPDD